MTVTSYVAVTALVLAVLELVLLVGVVVIARRFWFQVAPQVQPLLAMFAPSPSTVTITDAPPGAVTQQNETTAS